MEIALENKSKAIPFEVEGHRLAGGYSTSTCIDSGTAVSALTFSTAGTERLEVHQSSKRDWALMDGMVDDRTKILRDDLENNMTSRTQYRDVADGLGIPSFNDSNPLLVDMITDASENTGKETQDNNDASVDHTILDMASSSRSKAASDDSDADRQSKVRRSVMNKISSWLFEN
jgi:hypothetical protein